MQCYLHGGESHREQTGRVAHSILKSNNPSRKFKYLYFSSCGQGVTGSSTWVTLALFLQSSAAQNFIVFPRHSSHLITHRCKTSIRGAAQNVQWINALVSESDILRSPTWWKVRPDSAGF